MSKHLEQALSSMTLIFLLILFPLGCSNEYPGTADEGEGGHIDWMAGVPASPLLSPPLDHVAKEGDLFRLKVQEGKTIICEAIPLLGGVASAKIVPYKDGKPATEPKLCTNVAKKGIRTLFEHTPAEAEELVVFIEEGKVALSMKFLEMSEKTLSAGESLHLSLNNIPGSKLKCRFVNLTDGESTATIGYYMRGRVLEEIDGVHTDQINIALKGMLDLDTGMRDPVGDGLRVTVTSGKMVVKVGQFEPFKH